MVEGQGAHPRASGVRKQVWVCSADAGVCNALKAQSFFVLKMFFLSKGAPLPPQEEGVWAQYPVKLVFVMYIVIWNPRFGTTHQVLGRERRRNVGRVVGSAWAQGHNQHAHGYNCYTLLH